MWIVLLIVIIIFVILFKKYDKDFIVATPMNNKQYHLKFENDKEANCVLLNIFHYNNKEYYVFIPIESLKSIPDEDIIILQKYGQKEKRLIFNFADKETDEIIYKKVKKEYSNKYHFAE